MSASSSVIPFKVGQILRSSTLNSFFGIPVVNVLGYGATGNGVTDDTKAIQAAATAIGQAGGVLFFPSGTYLVSDWTAAASNVTIKGSGASSVMLASPAMVTASKYAFFANSNISGPIVDKNITVQDMQFSFVNFNNGAAHAINMQNAQTVKVINCVFNYGGDATAMIGCIDTLVQGCSAHNNNNCPYDHWGGAQDAKVIGCYADGLVAGQMVNFNAFLTGAGALTSSGCVVADCQFHNTGSGAGSININTLATNCAVKNVIISNNIITNGLITGIGDVENVTIVGNTFVGGAGTDSVIKFFSDGTTTPANINVLGNNLVNSNTASGNLGVIRVEATPFFISGNTISGGSYTAATCRTTTNAGVIGTNNFPTAPTGTAYTSATSNWIIPNGIYVQWLDNAGKPVEMRCDSSDFFALNTTDNTGATRLIWQILTNSASSGFRIAPLAQIGFSSTNFIRASGASTGLAPFISADPNSGDTNVSLEIAGKGTGGALLQGLSITGPPLAANLPQGYFTVAPNGSGGFALYYNASGSIKSVALS